MSIITNEFAAQLLSTLKNADESYLADVFQALERGMPLFNSRKLSEPKVKKEVKPKKEKVKEEDLPEASSGAPDASAYRMPPASIDISICVARITKDGEDKRWAPAVYRERQCGKDVTENGLCKTCSARAEKYEGKAGAWLGRVTEEPLEWVHMLGTEWAAKKKPVFKDGDSGADAESVGNGSQEIEMPEKEAAKVAEKVAEVEAKVAKVAKAKAKANVSEDKAAAKAAKEAEKAEKAAAKAAKEAEKEAAKAEKAAKAEAKKAKAEKKPKAKKAEVKVTEAEVKAVETEVVEVTGEMRIIEDVVYFIRNGNVYNYSELDEEIGSYVGRLKEGTIDTEADEVTAPESESE